VLLVSVLKQLLIIKDFHAANLLAKRNRLSNYRKKIKLKKIRINQILLDYFILLIYMPKKYTRRIRIRRVKRGGQERDIEMGPEQDIPYMGSVPPDPKRFEEYDLKNAKRELARTSSPAETEAFFEGPTPEQKLQREQKMMGDEDPLNKDPFDREDLTIFSDRGGRRTRKRRRNKRKNSRRRRR
jgi:hypothetical protein